MTPTQSLDVRYSDPEATPVPWADALDRLARAEVAWLVTVRPDGRPHATPLVPVVHGEKAYFHTGRNEVKYANLQANPRVLLLAGDTEWMRGLDVMFDGVAEEVTDHDVMQAVAARFSERWDGRWTLEVGGGAASVAAPDVDIAVFEVTPAKARGHAKGDPFGQTTYLFEEGAR